VLVLVGELVFEAVEVSPKKKELSFLRKLIEDIFIDRSKITANKYSMS